MFSKWDLVFDKKICRKESTVNQLQQTLLTLSRVKPLCKALLQPQVVDNPLSGPVKTATSKPHEDDREARSTHLTGWRIDKFVPYSQPPFNGLRVDDLLENNQFTMKHSGAFLHRSLAHHVKWR